MKRGRVILRRVGRKRSRVRIGVRVFVFFIVVALLVGGFAIALNMQIERIEQHRAMRNP